MLFSTNTGVLALDGATGHEQWSHPNPGDGPGAIPVAVADDTVYVWVTGMPLHEDD